MAYCGWFETNELQKKYHAEWGTPLHDDRMQFEYLSMEVMQCGLSFGLVLKKRDVLRRCFDDFETEKVAAYGEDDVARIMQTDGMIRAERKIRAIITNAAAFLKIQEEYGSFSDWLWAFTDGKTVCYKGHETGLVPARNALSEKISRALKKQGFKFVGPIVVYSHLQACGIINDHDADCPRRQYLIAHYPTVFKRRYGEKGLKQY